MNKNEGRIHKNEFGKCKNEQERAKNIEERLVNTHIFAKMLKNEWKMTNFLNKM